MSRIDRVRWIIASFIMPLWILRELNEAMKFRSAITKAIEAGEAAMTEDKALVECVRLHKHWKNSCGDLDNAPFLLCDRVEQLTAEVERLREALKKIGKAAFYYTLPKPALDIIHREASAALAGDSRDQ